MWRRRDSCARRRSSAPYRAATSLESTTNPHAWSNNHGSHTALDSHSLVTVASDRASFWNRGWTPIAQRSARQSAVVRLARAREQVLAVEHRSTTAESAGL